VASRTDHVAVLVVHGMGRHQPGKTREKLLAGLSRLARHDASCESSADYDSLIIGETPVRLYEVYWADLHLGDSTLGACQIEEVQAIAWFPFFNMMRRRYPKGSYSWAKLAWWCAILPFVNVVVGLGYDGISWVMRWRNAKYKGISRARLSGRTEKHASVLRILTKFFPTRSDDYTCVDAELDESLGDVLTYVNSAGQSFYREPGDVPAARLSAYQDIVKRFHDQLVQASSQEGCSEIQVIAHSLGTVITYHALAGFTPDRLPRSEAGSIQHALTKITRLYTIGSPLEKIRFFWPALAGVESPWLRQSIHWDNFVSWFDLVAGALRRFAEWGTTQNHRLLGGGFFRGHVVYEHSHVFLESLAHGLSGQEVRLRRTLKERGVDTLVLIGEFLFAPGLVVVTLAFGVLALGLQAAVLSYLIRNALDWVRPGLLAPQFTDVATNAFIVIAIVIINLVSPLRLASKAHARTRSDRVV
jgi:hypothetical protein